MIAVVLPVVHPFVHPFLMSNSHPLHPFFTSFEPVAHLLQAVVLAMVPLFFPTVSEAVHSDWSVHLLCGQERPPAICKTSSNLLLPVANTAIEDQQHSMDVNDDIRVEEDLFGMAELAGGRVLMLGRTLQQNKPGRGKGNLPSRSRRRRRRAPREKGGRDCQGGFGRGLCMMRTITWCGAPLHLRLVLLEKKGEYVTCLICHQKVSFNKYSWTTPRQHMRKHNINSPSDVEMVLQLAKQCLKEGRDFPEERLPRAGDSKGRPRMRKTTDYQAGGGFRLHARGTMAYSRV